MCIKKVEYSDLRDWFIVLVCHWNHRRHSRYEFDTCFVKIPWRRKWQPTLVFLPGKCHGWRSLAGYSLGGHKESDTTKQQQQQQHEKLHTSEEVEQSAGVMEGLHRLIPPCRRLGRFCEWLFRWTKKCSGGSWWVGPGVCHTCVLGILDLGRLLLSVPGISEPLKASLHLTVTVKVEILVVPASPAVWNNLPALHYYQEVKIVMRMKILLCDRNRCFKKNFWPHHTAYGILVTQPEIEPESLALEAWSFNH